MALCKYITLCPGLQPTSSKQKEIKIHVILGINWVHILNYWTTSLVRSYYVSPRYGRGRGTTAHRSIGFLFWRQNLVKFKFLFFFSQASYHTLCLPKEKFFKSFRPEKEVWWICQPYQPTALRMQGCDFPSKQPMNLQLIPEHDQSMATSLSSVKT